MLLKRKPAVWLTVATAAVLALSACSGGGDSTEDLGAGLEDCKQNPNTCNSGDRADGGELVWAIGNGWEEWNTNTASGNSVYLQQIIQGIFPTTGAWQPDGTFKYNSDFIDGEPQLISEDPQSWSYKIKPTAVWNDGTPIGVDDFIWHWYQLSGDEKYCTADCAPAATTYGAQVASIEESEPGTVVITLKDGEKNPEWATASPLSFPAHIATEQAPDWKTDPAEMAKTSKYFSETVPTWSGGPWLIDDATVGEQVVKVPNPAWYGTTKPTLAKLIIKVVADPKAILPAMQTGELNGSAPASIDADVVEQAASQQGVLSAVNRGPSWEHIDINVNNQWLSDVELRKAIFTAINVDDINTRTYGQITSDVEKRTNYMFPQSSPYYQDIIGPTGYGTGNVDTAKQMLTAAGYTIEGEGDAAKLMKGGEQVGPLRFRTLDGHPMRSITAEIVQSHLKKIGIEVTLDPIAADALGSALAEKDFDMVLFGWSGTPEFTTAPAQFWGSESASNFGGNANEALDAKLAEIRQTTDIAESAKFTNEAMAMVAADAYILPLVSTPALVLVSDKYVNIRDNSSTSLRSLYNTEEWGLKAN